MVKDKFEQSGCGKWKFEKKFLRCEEAEQATSVGELKKARVQLGCHTAWRRRTLNLSAFAVFRCGLKFQ